MRSQLCWLLTVSVLLVPSDTQAQSSANELAVGPHIVNREDSPGSHIGGGVAVARRFGRLAAVVEAGGTRREGHNDWRALGGVRVNVNDNARTLVFVQGLVGTLIRQRAADWAVLPGVGADLTWSQSLAIRFQADVPIDRSQGQTAFGIRASLWLVFGAR